MIDRLPDILAGYEREPLQDACGIVGILASSEGKHFNTGFLALKRLQTRGYDAAGFTALKDDNKVLLHIEQGTIREVFPPNIISLINTNTFYEGLWQVRYGTSGNFSAANAQPYIRRHAISNQIFIVDHNGQFSKRRGDPIDSLSDTARFVTRLAESKEDTWDERIINTLSKEKGAWSLIIGTDDSMYLSRDPLGIRPLYFSQKSEGDEHFTIAASETEALLSAGFSHFQEVLPGQILRFDRSKKGYSIIQEGRSQTPSHCMFENVYTLDENGRALLPRTNSECVNESPTVKEIRSRCGKQLALEAPLSSNEVDMVIGVPGTGITGGEAYAKALGLYYEQAICDKEKDPSYEERTFMQAQIDEILKKVQDHFNYNIESLRGKRVVLVDDSIVRGNISRGLIRFLKEVCGVKEVHFRVLCPPIDKPCHLGINTRTQLELIANNYHGDIDSICKDIGADSLAYLSSEGLLWAATGNPKAKGFCMGCMLGQKHPIDQYGCLE